MIRDEDENYASVCMCIWCVGWNKWYSMNGKERVQEWCIGDGNDTRIKDLAAEVFTASFDGRLVQDVVEQFRQSLHPCIAEYQSTNLLDHLLVSLALPHTSK